MDDLTYATAVTATAPHVVLIGPARCRGCGAWVEWAGVDWLDRGTLDRHQCDRHVAGRTQLLGAAIRQESGLPRWAQYLGTGIVWATASLAILFLGLLVIGQVSRP